MCRIAKHYLPVLVVLLVLVIQLVHVAHETLVVLYYHPDLAVHLVQVIQLVQEVHVIPAIQTVRWHQLLQQDLGNLVDLVFRVVLEDLVGSHVAR